MLLPNSTVRASYKLQNPAQRLMWASNQLISGLYPLPIATIAAPNANQSHPPRKGINPLFAELLSKNSIKDEISDSTYAYARFWLPYDIANASRGVGIQQCIRSLSDDAILPNLYTTPVVGEPVLDNSTATTIEQYIYEQAMLLRDLAPSRQYIEIAQEDWYSTDYAYKVFPVVKIDVTVLKNGTYEGDGYWHYNNYIA
jgi:hypothetical protein